MIAEHAIPSHEAAQAPDPMGPQPFRVIKVKEEIAGCTTLTVEPENDEAKKLCFFQPGQFHMIYVFGQGEIPISISGDPSHPQQLVFTIMGVGTVSRALTKLKAGDMVGLRGPFGNTWPVEKGAGKDVMLIAGGLGLAPLRPTIYSILARRELYSRVMLLYGSRRPENILFQEQLDLWNKRMEMNVGITVDSADKKWDGNVGVVTELINDTSFSPTRTIAMICGPEVMMRFSAHALMDRGMSPKNIYVSMERNMKCAVGQCGRCQYGQYFMCKDGPVFSFEQVEQLYKVREV
ncbi:MAG: Ni/Fe hydrogenase subunit gamma [Alphaproteobacteria bacterium]|nr:Ni/Fe hydrogenase subunit gamma [Alphaproteobacteria bacterium]